MVSIGGSVEDFIIKKLRLNEMLKADQVNAVLNYFISIIKGEVKTTPPELKGLLSLMLAKLEDDEDAVITEYILTHDEEIVDFFNENFQRFNYYEFKPLLLMIKGELPSDEFKVPVNDQRNFEIMEPLDVTPYMEILEPNQADVKIKKEKIEKKDIENIEKEKEEDNSSFDEKIESFKKKIMFNIQKGVYSKDVVQKNLERVEEDCIPALQLKYNNSLIENLNGYLLGSADLKGKRPSEIFEGLNMSVVSRELFYRLLKKKTENLLKGVS